MAMTLEQTARDRQPAPTQTEKGRATRRTAMLGPTEASIGDIPDMEAGHSWLMAKGLLAPSGTTLMLTSLIEALFLVRTLPNMPLQTQNGIHAIAMLLQRLGEEYIAKEVTGAITKELTPLFSEIKSTLKEKTEEAINKLREESDELTTRAKAATEEMNKVIRNMADTAEKGREIDTPYWNALINRVTGPPVQIDLRVRARESIQAREFLWPLSTDS